MAAYVDQPQLRRLHRLSQRQSRITINVYAQLLLLLSIFLSVLLSMPTYAATDSSTSESIILNNEATEDSTADSGTSAQTPNAPAINAPPANEPNNSLNSAITITPATPSTSDTAPAPVEKPPVISGESTNNAQIETTPTPLKDNDIQQRISSIFSEIDGLQAVSVSVNQGVVTLTGETPNEKKAQQAINLTNRLTDVVTVEDRINRTLDVQDNVSTVYQSLKAQTKNLVKALPLLLVGIVLFALVTWFGSWLSNRQKMWQRLTPNPFVAELLAQTVKVIFIIFGLILALSLIGAETILGTLLGGAGVIGIAVGFAVKDTIENYIASLMLSIRQPFRARDHILINKQEGIVVRLTSRATILMTLDGNQLRIPNAEVFKATILNFFCVSARPLVFHIAVGRRPQVKTGYRSIRAVTFMVLFCQRRGYFFMPVQPFKPVLNSSVTKTQYIFAPQRKNQLHLRRPFANAVQFYQFCNNFFIGRNNRTDFTDNRSSIVQQLHKKNLKTHHKKQTLRFFQP